MAKKLTERQRAFVKQLAEFLVGNQAGKSIALQLEREHPKPAPVPNLAIEWAALRSATPIFGYPTVEEAEAKLMDFLFEVEL